MACIGRLQAAIILLTQVLFLGACGDPQPARVDAAAVDELADGLSVQAFREYGKSSPTRIRTRVGDLLFTEGGFAGGYPTRETVALLFDEMDFQRATQAYLWAVPLVSYAEWVHVHEEIFHAEDGQLVQHKTALAKQGILTANATTPYVIAFADLTRTGPLVFDIPAGPSAGVINDMWQRAVWDFGVSGPDAGKGARLLLASCWPCSTRWVYARVSRSSRTSGSAACSRRPPSSERPWPRPIPSTSASRAGTCTAGHTGTS